jgi:hypothetical protein
MAKLLITTQVYENYGAHDWDGEGECPDYWKAKGGSDYVIKNVDECDMVDIIVDRVRDQIEMDNEVFREYIIGYRIVADDYMTEFERDQLEYEGVVRFPAKELVVFS